MKILNFGSLNIDNVYSVDHIVGAGETILSTKRQRFVGGKGLNQSIAMARAGLDVFHAGIIGNDGDILIETLNENGVDTSLVKKENELTGHTFIQVDKDGQNSIVLYGGTNQMITEYYIMEVLDRFEKNDLIILQNEINCLDKIIDIASSKGMIIALNPSPYNEKITKCSLDKVSIFFVNEIEGAEISSENADEPGKIMDWFESALINAELVLTLGEKGAWYADPVRGIRYYQPANDVTTVDTTAAGDTFTGYFLSSWTKGEKPELCMKRAADAAAISVSRNGAASSIPYENELE